MVVSPPGIGVALLGTSLALVNFGIDEIANPHLRVQPRQAKSDSADVTPVRIDTTAREQTASE